MDIPGYIIHRRDRNRNGGGVCIYIKSDLAFNPRPDLSHDGLESLWVEVLLPKTPPILTGVCYRPPKQNDFYELLEQSCAGGHIFVEHEIILLGDFNTNVMLKKNSLVSALRNFQRMFGFKQLITEPTRVCARSEFWT